VHIAVHRIPIEAPRPKGPPCPRAWLGAASGAGGAALTDAALGGLIDTSELVRSFQKAPRPGGGSTTEAWPALLGCSCSLAVDRAQSRAIGSYD
jgi:hypothetical protein